MQVVTGLVVEGEEDENEAGREDGPGHFLTALRKRGYGPQKQHPAWVEAVEGGATDGSISEGRRHLTGDRR